ncbi:mannitol-1-phosphate 5-dehydrogenase [Exiguobacterium flavidum]|uniref:mannitol-1-phosphate 5-dehydrogenase n=1 Tax=Exiguobacterium flavidum TaxID=2184695 RepID=UPI000DF7620B|nr:mannitol-1-phosphate 5-dehydrogenase [Exiguobacterium flavidum]
MIAVHFGAGNIGRGFIGLQLSKSGYEVWFVDVNEAIVEELALRNSYQVGFAAESVDPVTVENVNALSSLKEREAVIEKIRQADVVTTAVGPHLLERVAPIIAEGIAARDMNDPLYVIACENMIGGSEVLKGFVEQTTDLDGRDIYFPNAAVDRIVPLQHHEDPLYVEVEEFFEWVVETKGLPENRIELQDVVFVDEITPYIERKLFTVNTGHALASYVGHQYGKETIAEAMKDLRVRKVVQGALYETGWLLLEKYGFSAAEHSEYIQKIMRRFENPLIHDEVGRVARSPIRKLGPQDRLVKPARELMERGYAPYNLAFGIAGALGYEDAQDAESVELSAFISESGVDEALSNYLKLESGSELERLIVAQYDSLELNTESLT